MGDDAGGNASEEVCEEGTREEVAEAERVEHGGVCGKIAAPAHTHGGADSNGVAVEDALLGKFRNEAEGSTHGTKGGDGERDEFGSGETEEPFEDDVDVSRQSGKQARTFVGSTAVCDGLHAGSIHADLSAEGEHHHHSGDDKYARDDGESDVHTALSAVEECVEGAYEGGVGRFRFLIAVGIVRGLLIVHISIVAGRFIAVRRIVLAGEVLHEARGDDATGKGSEESDERSGKIALAYHEDDDNESHTEGRAEVGERDELVLLEIAAELAVLRERDDGGVVAEECEHRSQRCHSGEIEERCHDGTEDALYHVHHAKLHENLSQGSGDDADTHEVQDGVEQQIVGGSHDGVQHVGKTHATGEIAEEDNDDKEAGDAPEDVVSGVFHRLLEGLFHGFCGRVSGRIPNRCLRFAEEVERLVDDLD